MKNAAIEFDEVGFWYGRVADDHGLRPDWEAHAAPIDMWADVAAALEDLETALEALPTVSHWDLVERAARPLAVLCGAERIGLWALA